MESSHTINESSVPISRAKRPGVKQGGTSIERSRHRANFSLKDREI